MSKVISVPSEYAPGGHVLVEVPDRPAKTAAEFAAEQVADRIQGPKLLKALAWTDAQLALAQGRYGFPRSIGRTVTGWGRSDDGLPVYSKKAILRWFDEFEGFALTVKRPRW